MTTQDGLQGQAGDRFEVAMYWQLEGAQKARVWATFVAGVVARDEGRYRLLCRLEDILSLRASHPPETLDEDMLARIKGLVGRYAYLPPEAADGVTLHLKLSTLTGAHGYFFDERPVGGERKAG